MKGGSFIIPVLFILSLLNISMVSADYHLGMVLDEQNEYLETFKVKINEKLDDMLENTERILNNIDQDTENLADKLKETQKLILDGAVKEDNR